MRSEAFWRDVTSRALSEHLRRTSQGSGSDESSIGSRPGVTSGIGGDDRRTGVPRAAPLMSVPRTMIGAKTSKEVIDMSYDIGEKPGKGTYSDAYGHTVTLDDNSDVLPPCGICGAGQVTKWTRV
jgi:hypothetical protein